MNTILPNPDIEYIQPLLAENGLPTDDLAALDLNHFFTCRDASRTIAVIGLEVFGTDALLRSLAVQRDYRGHGCGALLLQAAETHAQQSGIRNLYLLTETAEEYFSRRGFASVERSLAPVAISSTRQFGELCPADAVFMHKPLGISG